MQNTSPTFSSFEYLLAGGSTFLLIIGVILLILGVLIPFFIWRSWARLGRIEKQLIEANQSLYRISVREISDPGLRNLPASLAEQFNETRRTNQLLEWVGGQLAAKQPQQ